MISPAFAQTPPPGFGSIQDMMLRGDISITKNNLGILITELPPGQTTEQLFAFSGTSPIIWGRYYQDSASGLIQSTRLQRNFQTGGVTLITENLTPGMGQIFGTGNNIVSDFKGTNPFGDFNNGTATYTNLTLNAFMTATGMWAKNKTSSKGFIVATQHEFHGAYNWDECIKKILKACIKKRFHTEAYADVKPSWYLMVPSDVAGGRGTLVSYNSDTCIAAGGSSNECQVRTGSVFVKATSGGDFPKDIEKMWHRHVHQDGWAGWFVMLVTALVTGIVLLPVGAGVSGLLGGLGVPLSGTGFRDYTAGFWGHVINGKQTAGAMGDWSPIGCISGAVGSAGGDGAGRYGNGECKTFIGPNISTTGAGVGALYNEKVQNPSFDYAISNDTEILRASPNRPLLIGGVPIRD